MFKDEVLENERRREIYQLIEKNPGLHLREVQRRLNMPLTSLEYHLSYMIRRKILLREKDGRYERYYVKQLDSEDKRVLSAFRQKRIREIVLIVLVNRKVKYQTLLDILKIPMSTLSLYLKYLVAHRVLVRHRIGHESIYTVEDEERIAKVLIAYKSSFVDKLVDKALATWAETQFRESNHEKAIESQGYAH